MKSWIVVLALMLAMSAVKSSSLSSKSVDLASDSTPASCALPPPTHPSFYCVNGQWHSNESITAETLTLPPNAGTVYLEGNLTVSTLIFNGISTSIHMAGSDNVAPVMRVVFTKDQLEGLARIRPYYGVSRLLSLGTYPQRNYTDIYTDMIVDTSKASSCLRVTASRDTSVPDKIVVFFSVYNIRCKIWWITLLSIIGAAIIVVGIVLCCKYRPCANSQNHKSNGGFNN